MPVRILDRHRNEDEVHGHRDLVQVVSGVHFLRSAAGRHRLDGRHGRRSRGLISGGRGGRRLLGSTIGLGARGRREVRGEGGGRFHGRRGIGYVLWLLRFLLVLRSGGCILRKPAQHRPKDRDSDDPTRNRSFTYSKQWILRSRATVLVVRCSNSQTWSVPLYQNRLTKNPREFLHGEKLHLPPPGRGGHRSGGMARRRATSGFAKRTGDDGDPQGQRERGPVVLQREGQKGRADSESDQGRLRSCRRW